MIITKEEVSTFDYRDSFKYFCLKNCICQLLSTKVEDPFAYINCAPCVYFYFSDQLPDGYAVRYNKNPLQESYESSFKLIVPMQKYAEMNFENIIKTLDKNIPVIASTDVYYLPYKQYYHKYHASHAIIIHGYDNASKIIDVIDFYDHNFFVETLSYADFFNSWSSDNPSDVNPFSGWPINNIWGFLKPLETNVISLELVKNTLVSTLNFLHGRNGKKL